jgi:hypothetical protein
MALKTSRETGNIRHSRCRRTKQKHNTICVWHHYTGLPFWHITFLCFNKMTTSVASKQKWYKCTL